MLSFRSRIISAVCYFKISFSLHIVSDMVPVFSKFVARFLLSCFSRSHKIVEERNDTVTGEGETTVCKKLSYERIKVDFDPGKKKSTV